MDKKTIFLNGFIEDEVYTMQPKCFETFNRESHVCRLKSALYGLKYAPCSWYTRIDSCLIGRRNFQGNLKWRTRVSCTTSLGWKYDKAMGKLFVSQGKYVNEILWMETCKPMETPLATNWRKETATLGEEVDVTIYQGLVGSLMYLVNTWPNMCFWVN